MTWCAETGMMEASDKDISSGVNKVSADEPLGRHLRQLDRARDTGIHTSF